ncbi:MAG: hypothetical protein AB7K63_05900 [Vicinamibacterales bacterium]
MAEVLVEFDRPVTVDGTTYSARAVGRRADDGMWEGWLEFVPVEGEPVIGAVESRQPEYEHLVYWATGLTSVFLEGALARALHPLAVRVRVVPEPFSDAPAPRSTPPAHVVAGPEAVLDPFDVGGRSLDILRQELTALNRPRLLNIIAAFDLNPAGEDLAWMSDGQLATFIVTATETRLARRP